MKIKTTKIKEVLLKIYNDTYCSSDIGLLFLWLRPIIKGENLLMDLANFVAHGDERDQGASYDHILKYILNFIDVSESRGTIHGLKPLFNKQEIIIKLIKIIDKLDVGLKKDEIIKRTEGITNSLLDLMEESEFNFSKVDERIVRCYLKRVDKKILFCLNLNLSGPHIIVPPDMTIQSTLFD